MSSILAQLNPQQQEAVVHGNGPLLIFAGAGSGKTRVLTNRIAYLIRERGVRPYNIIAVTFTNKAANEMRERIEALVGGALSGMWVGTFHSMCARILRAHGDRIGVDSRFVIFDTGDQETLIKQSLQELNIDAQRFRPQEVLAVISNAKNELIDARRFASTARDFRERTIARVYELYQRKLRLNRACDFDDLLILAVQLLRDHLDVAAQYQERFQHVLVDEYQDINFAQYRLVENLARKHRNICVVGDDDQSIYSWRGADIRLILQFEKDYPDVKVVKLEQNYRSTQVILDAAYHVIRKNLHRSEKKLWTERRGGSPVILQETANEQEEAQFVVEQVQEKCQTQGRPYSDFAVLYRVNAQSRVLEETFVKHRVPYRIVGAVQFYQRKEIKDILAYLKLMYNPLDAVSLRRVINVPARGIGQKTMEHLDEEAARRGISLMEVMLTVAARFQAEKTQKGSRPKGNNLKEPSPSSVPPQLTAPRVAKNIFGFVRLFEELHQDFAKTNSITALVNSILSRTGYQHALEEEMSLDAAERLENLREFISATQMFDARASAGDAEVLNMSTQANVPDTLPVPDAPRPTTEAHAPAVRGGEELLGAFLESIALVSDVDKLDERANAVTLMTLHAAKGLEFPVVFMVGMEQNIFPHSRARFDERQMEEERRLCYVGLTRAREQVILTHAHRRTFYGLTSDAKLSQFVTDIPPSLLHVRSSQHTWREHLEQDADWPTRSSQSQISIAASSRVAHTGKDARGKLHSAETQTEPVTDGYRVGDKVHHATWGQGIVVRVSANNGQQEWVEVAFPRSDVGIKKLMLAYAPLEKIL